MSVLYHPNGHPVAAAVAAVEAARSDKSRGEEFAFTLYEYDKDGIGTIANGEIVAVLSPEHLTGIRMNPADALRLGSALIQCAMNNAVEVPA